MLSRKPYVYNTTSQYKILDLPEKLILLIYRNMLYAFAYQQTKTFAPNCSSFKIRFDIEYRFT